MIPNWRHAPKWAKWVAMDQSGYWYWYEKEPIISKEMRGTWVRKGGKCAQVDESDFDWSKSKEKRP